MKRDFRKELFLPLIRGETRSMPRQVKLGSNPNGCTSKEGSKEGFNDKLMTVVAVKTATEGNPL
jgi:hypothetical protein